MADVTKNSLLQDIESAHMEIVAAIGHPLGQQKESEKISFAEGSKMQFAPVDEATMSAFIEKLRSGERPAASPENHASLADNKTPDPIGQGTGKGRDIIS